MLLSHNFNVYPETIPPLSTEEFALTFVEGLREYTKIKCRKVDHPHWMAEIIFSRDDFSPQQVGELCAQALVKKRQEQGVETDAETGIMYEILILGGVKTTPATSNAPDALQPGNWGVDVVETASGADFLQVIAWENTITQHPPENIFKVELKPKN
ncbi:DUF2656 domain-containing protein [Merismopedia glauca CCAP 1448/3]|uniref:DUF2656 domain-containing protein n=2 Tax=Merismopedia TaxID=53402 RepID=A0A2T1C9G7_9CYAN|nr:DUF2656 domain-containing protein [Merismopedia glauca CCAP 1448/3]